MSRRFASFAASVLVLVLPDCMYQRDPTHCPGKNPNNNCLDPALVPGAKPCTTSAECSGPTPVCDLEGTQMCVACTAADASACTGSTPICGDDRACHACTAHTDCSSEPCLPDGSCGDDLRVAYVHPAGFDNLACTSAAPCRRVSLALATGRPYVKLAGVIDEQVVVGGGRVVTFVGGPGAILTRVSGPGPTVTVRDDGTSLAIYDLTISDTNQVGVGLLISVGGSPSVTLVRVKVFNNPGVAISANGSGSLTVTQSFFARNTGGAISVTDGTFAIVGNMFYGNGSPGATVGGIFIDTPWGGNRLEFNSFSRNVANDMTGPAIHCDSVSIAARNNIMSDNGTVTNPDQVRGSCTHAYSIVRPGVLPLGPGNMSVDPLFVNPSQGDLHIRPGSPARGAADPSSSLTGIAERDLDGDARTSPADIGADEVP